MTTTSLTPAVIDYLVTAAGNSAALGGASPRVTIHDGPPLSNDTLAEPLHLYIGWNQVSQGSEDPSAVQAWPVMDKARTKDEDGTVVCTADAWSGDTTMKTQRDACKAIVAAAELLLRGDGTTGPGDATMGGLVFWSGIDALQWFPRQMPDGAGMACVFTITYRARLVTTGA